MLNVDDLLLGTETDLTLNPLSIRLHGRAFVLLEDDRGFLPFCTFRDREAMPFLQTLTHIYHLGLEEEEITMLPSTGVIV